VAELQLEGAELVLHLSGAEKAEAVHGDLRVPLSALRGVEVLDDAHAWTGIGVGFKVGSVSPASPLWPLSAATARRCSSPSIAIRPAA
jgi:hypothetical protein